MAVISWITDGKHQCTLSSSEFGDVIMAGSTITTNSQVGIDEDAISVISSEDDETEVLEDLTDDENEDEEEVEGTDNDSK